MASLNRRWLRWIVVGLALLPSGAHAQSVAQSFQELQGILKTGEIVVVVDKAGEETWGQVTEVSGASLGLAIMEKPADRPGTVVTSRTRTFAADTVEQIARSDLSGVRGTVIFPASWEKVSEVRPGSPITVVLKTGERRDFRFKTIGPGDLTLTTADGREETLSKSLVDRVVRRGYSDPTGNGLAYGGAIGAGTAFTMMAMMFARCDAGCEAPAPGPTYAAAAAFGGAIGAAVGWALDKAHKDSEMLFPIVSAGRKGVGLSRRF